LDLTIGKSQQQLAGGTHPKRKGSAQLDEGPENLPTFDRRDADPGVVFADIEVDAFLQMVAQATHWLFCHDAKVERVGRGFTPIEQTRA
jgi:hypothetical protein